MSEEALAYRQMVLNVEEGAKLLEDKRREVESSFLLKAVKVREFNREKDGRAFIELFNKVFQASPDPYLPLKGEEVDEIPEEGFFVAEINGRIVGFIIAFVTGGGKIGVIGVIGVDPDYRRMGIATALAVKAAEYLIEKGVEKVVTEVYVDNISSYNLIKSFGFKETAIAVYGIMEAACKRHPIRTRSATR